jgi:hypothetical protein
MRCQLSAKFTIEEGWTISAIAVISSFERNRRDMMAESVSLKRAVWGSEKMVERING